MQARSSSGDYYAKLRQARRHNTFWSFLQGECRVHARLGGPQFACIHVYIRDHVLLKICTQLHTKIIYIYIKRERERERERERAKERK